MADSDVPFRLPVLPRAQSALVGRSGDDPARAATPEWFDFFRLLLDSSTTTGELRAEVESILAQLDTLTAATIEGAQSVQVLGTLADGAVNLKLRGDEIDPGQTYYYGTGPDGVKGWNAVADTLAVDAGELTKSVDADGVTSFGLATVGDAGGGTLQKWQFDTFGRKVGGSAATTDDLTEGALNLYFTVARARAAVITSTITDGDTTHSPDGNSVFDALAGKETAGAAAAALAAAEAYTDAEIAAIDNIGGVLYVDVPNGRVGIGTASPLFQFHVEGTTAGLYLNRTVANESFIALAMAGASKGQVRAISAGGLKVTDGAGTTEWVRFDGDLSLRQGRLYGLALHNNAGGMAGATNQFVGSGTYTPTLTGVANVDAATSNVCQYMRVGNVVTVSGTINVDTTTASTLTQLGISLPIASALTSFVQCCGTANSRIANAFGIITGDATNDRAQLEFANAVGTGNSAWFFQFTYTVL